MFAYTSRYYQLPTFTIRRVDGRQVKYVARRIVPQPETMATLLEVRLAEGDRLDTIAAASLGAPELFWQICDANNVAHPFELTEQIGEMIRVPMPAPPAL